MGSFLIRIFAFVALRNVIPSGVEGEAEGSFSLIYEIF